MFSASKTGAGASGYPIVNSLRFQSASTQYLTRTIATTTNQKTYTLSCWVKRGQITSASDQTILGVRNAASNQVTYFYFDTSDKLHFFDRNSSLVVQGEYSTNAVFRDPSAWYHVMLVVDTTQATATNRCLIYVNGVSQTLTASTTFAQNTNTSVNTNGQTPNIGAMAVSYGAYLDGYLSEINFIDGQALTPSSFGTTDPTSGQWVAKKYTGTYGTNGFFLKFANGTSTTTLGSDSSGNGNNWTLTNFTRSAGVSDCWMYDVPSGNSGASGTQPSANYNVLNPLNNYGYSLTKGNLAATLATGGNFNYQTRGTIAVSSGKYYFELRTGTITNIGSPMIGVCDPSLANNTQLATNAKAWLYYGYNGQKYNGSGAAYGSTWTSNATVGVALDMDAGTIAFYLNGVSQGTAFSNLAGNLVSPVIFGDQGPATYSCDINFGQRSFAYTPPSGFKALCTANLPVATIKQGNKYMDAIPYTGSGVNGRSVTGYNFNPDLVWVKRRSAAENNVLANTITGGGKTLYSNLTIAEQTNEAGGYIASFVSNGFTVSGGSSNDGAVNTSGSTYVGWGWSAGNNTTSSNTNGSITSTVSVNATAGFSIVTYTGNSTSGATIGHGLGIAPKMIITKTRNTTLGNWGVYHESLGNTRGLNLNTTVAAFTGAAWWNNTTPTSSVFTVGNGNDVNGASTYVAYCFAEIAGFSKFGSYTGNGSTDGPFVYCGFRPKYVMWKSAGEVSFWNIVDTSRSPDNVSVNYLNPNSSSAEGAANLIDTLSNGFKLRVNSAGNNASGQTYIFMAFAENPFAQANAH